MSERRRIAVLGGGVGALVAAWELTATPERCKQFDVTVYQLGWRCGGKGASGRNLEQGGRIEEHGLHLWFGFYDNAFRVMRDAYEELGRKRGTPLARLDDAFKPCDEIVLYDRQDKEWQGFSVVWPANDGEPGDGQELPSFWDIAAMFARWALGEWKIVLGDHPDLEETPAPHPHGWRGFIRVFIEHAFGRAKEAVAEGTGGVLEHAVEMAEHARGIAAAQAVEEAFVSMLTGFRDVLWGQQAVQDRVAQDPRVRLFFTAFDVGVSTVAGLVRDNVMEDGFDSINNEELCEWLARHGAKQVTLGTTPAERCPLLRSLYDVAFGYVEGDIDRADIAAGTAVNDLLRLVFTFRGHIAYKMQAGMGDTVFGPFYEVLRERGVTFEFFSAVTALRPHATDPLVQEIDVVAQVEVTRKSGYDPLVDVSGLPCWPSTPVWEQLKDGQALAQHGVDFEGDPNPLGRPVRTLRREKDFDDVVLGISVGALPPICAELMKRDDRFRAGIEKAEVVRTQAFQLWLGDTAKSMGWPFTESSVAGSYIEPLDTYCDMTHLLGREDHPKDAGVRSIAYFCGVLDHRDETQEEATARVKSNALAFMRGDLLGLWPQTGADEALAALAAPHDKQGENRFDHQYWRANTQGSELYVLTPAGSVQHRLPSGDSGFDNLLLAGDWTKNGVDGGCVEAAALSGLQAARALLRARPAPVPAVPPPPRPGVAPGPAPAGAPEAGPPPGAAPEPPPGAAPPPLVGEDTRWLRGSAP